MCQLPKDQRKAASNGEDRWLKKNAVDIAGDQGTHGSSKKKSAVVGTVDKPRKSTGNAIDPGSGSNDRKSYSLTRYLAFPDPGEELAVKGKRTTNNWFADSTTK